MPNGKPRRLKRLKLAEISVVGNPAQQHAKITVTKSTNKAAAQTSEAQGHRHNVIITGNGSMGLNLILTEHTGDDGESHTHPIVRTRGGWTVGVAAGHTHTLPDVSTIISRLLESDPEPDPDPEPEVGKGDSIDTPMTSIVGGHCHVVALAKDDGFALHTSGSTAGESHTHKVVKQSDGSYQVAPGANGHTHTLPGSPDALRKALKGSDPLSAAPESTENPTMTETAFEKSRRLAKAIEDDMDALAEECRVDFPELSPEQAFAKMLRSVKGQELWGQHCELDREAQLSKSEDQLNFEARCEARIDVLVKAATGKWASPAENQAVRSRVGSEFYAGSEFEAMHAEFTATQLAKHVAPEPELECVQAGLLSKAEIESNPEAALDRLAAQVAWRDSITKAQAVASFAEPGSIGYEVLELAYAAEVARSDAIMNG